MGKEKYYFIMMFTVGTITARSTNILFPDSSALAAVKVPPSARSSQIACGVNRVLRDRVVGGVQSSLGAWPWIAAIGYQQNDGDGSTAFGWKCAGTLITGRHVITAAHCLVGLPEGLAPRLVRLGDLDLDGEVADGATPVDVPIESMVAHPGYLYDGKLVNDVALLTLAENVTFTEQVRPICLPNASETDDGVSLKRRVLTVAGWGSVRSDTLHNRSVPPNTKLMEVELPVTDPERCREAYVNDNNVIIDDSVICAGNPYGGYDSCRGDSGGPLMMPKRKLYYLIGIVSFGPGVCGARGIPGVYTKVSSFVRWIDEKIHQNRDFTVKNPAVQQSPIE